MPPPPVFLFFFFLKHFILMSMNILPACDVRHSQRLEEGGMVVRRRVGARHGTQVFLKNSVFNL